MHYGLALRFAASGAHSERDLKVPQLDRGFLALFYDAKQIAPSPKVMVIGGTGKYKGITGTASYTMRELHDTRSAVGRPLLSTQGHLGDQIIEVAC